KVMTKCTLCVDRLADRTLPEEQRLPACVLACPTRARLFGDIHDPQSGVSVAIRDRGGYAPMPEWGTRPSTHYLPRRRTEIDVRADQLVREANPLRVDGREPEVGAGAPLDAEWEH